MDIANLCACQSRENRKKWRHSVSVVLHTFLTHVHGTEQSFIFPITPLSLLLQQVKISVVKKVLFLGDTVMETLRCTRKGGGRRLTENSMFFLSWLTARRSGTASVCLITLTDSPVRHKFWSGGQGGKQTSKRLNLFIFLLVRLCHDTYRSEWTGPHAGLWI